MKKFINPCVFWLFAFLIGLLIVWIIQRVNTWLLLGRFRLRRCDRHIYCNEWKVSTNVWYLFSFSYLFVIGLLTGYRWYAGLVFLIVFEVARWLITYCTPQYWEEKCSRCGVDFALGFLGYLLGLVFRHALCWFPATPCWATPF